MKKDVREGSMFRWDDGDWDTMKLGRKLQIVNIGIPCNLS